MEWYLKVLRDYATFTGRARRREYWMFVLFSIIVQIVLRVVDALIGTSDLFHMYPPSLSWAGIGLLTSLYTLAVLLPTLAVAARRLHDTGRSGWWQALILLYVLALAPSITTGVAALVIGLIGSLVGLAAAVLLIVWYALDGEPGPNAYGSNPKAVDVSPSW